MPLYCIKMFHYMLYASLENIMQQTVNLLIKKSVLYISKKKLEFFTYYSKSMIWQLLLKIKGSDSFTKPQPKFYGADKDQVVVFYEKTLKEY